MWSLGRGLGLSGMGISRGHASISSGLGQRSGLQIGAFRDKI